MIAVTGKKLSEIYADIEAECGKIYMEERDYKSTRRKRSRTKILLEEKQLPALPYEIDHVSYLDGSKVYFKNGGWVVAASPAPNPDPNLLRNARRTTGKRSLPNLRTVPRPELIK